MLNNFFIKYCLNSNLNPIVLDIKYKDFIGKIDKKLHAKEFGKNLINHWDILFFSLKN